MNISIPSIPQAPQKRLNKGLDKITSAKTKRTKAHAQFDQLLAGGKKTDEAIVEVLTATAGTLKTGPANLPDAIAAAKVKEEVPKTTKMKTIKQDEPTDNRRGVPAIIAALAAVVSFLIIFFIGFFTVPTDRQAIAVVSWIIAAIVIGGTTYFLVKWKFNQSEKVSAASTS